MRCFSISAALVLLALPLGAQNDVDAVLSRAQAAYARVNTTKATFDQTITNEMTGTTAVSHGELIQEQPNRLSVTFTEPAGDRIVADGKSLWVYVPSATPGQVIKMPLGANGTGAIDFVQQFVHAPRQHFDVTAGKADTSLGHPAHTLMLVPKDPGSSIAKATVWVDDDDGVVRQFVVTDGTGATRHVRLSGIEFNVPVQKSTFAFKPPPGIKIVDRQAMSSGAGT
ncbi:MAG TPA: outer membrane lipoprotein chaperone LolA [Gemmatimonadaceae bacterium]|jgi:outer membrane lipoprotein carrier protein|nr:outer membrane lipoprotein chaperone LolA [Gemmatimonadaceae bacterium]